jgi:hypothetical protein
VLLLASERLQATLEQLVGYAAILGIELRRQKVVFEIDAAEVSVGEGVVVDLESEIRLRGDLEIGARTRVADTGDGHVLACG